MSARERAFAPRRSSSVETRAQNREISPAGSAWRFVLSDVAAVSRTRLLTSRRFESVSPPTNVARLGSTERPLIKI
jgi:hypothetical protein